MSRNSCVSDTKCVNLNYSDCVSAMQSTIKVTAFVVIAVATNALAQRSPLQSMTALVDTIKDAMGVVGGLLAALFSNLYDLLTNSTSSLRVVGGNDGDSSHEQWRSRLTSTT